MKMIFSNLDFQKGGNCQGRSSSPFRIMQIVSLIVRIASRRPCRERSHGSSAQLGPPRGLLWFYLQGGHPSEAIVDKRFCVHSCCLLLLCFAPTACFKKEIVKLLTSDVSIERDYAFPLNLSALFSTPSNLAALSCAGFLHHHTTLCMNQMQDDVYYACFADAANQSVATHDSGCPVFQVARTGIKMCDKALPMKGSGNLVLECMAKSAPVTWLLPRNRLLVGPCGDIFLFWEVLVC